jgi:hypothetical protein
VSSSQPADDVTEALRSSVDALSAGAVVRWRPLPDGLTESGLLAAYPVAIAEQGRLLGQPATSHRLPESAHAPRGILVWSQQGEVTLVEVRDAAVDEEELTRLGPPEATLPSGLGDAFEQLLWPSRGLVIHRAPSTGRILVLYGHHAATVAQMEQSPLSQVRVERRPLR